MNDTSEQLVNSVRNALVLHRVKTDDADRAGAIAVVAVLRELSIMMNDAADEGVDWPDAGDISLLADDVESTL